MTDYNDGKWHGWNGGECPVDLLATVEHVWLFNDGTGSSFVRDTPAGNVTFLGYEYGQVIAFRVTKPAPPKPREWWLRMGPSGEICGTDPADGDPPPNWDPSRTIRVIEKLPETN